ncbi:MAG: hypothetical protein HN976_03425, partial [Lentisphaerae bacterium]|nr:hypothetical protein [Lentisphaerota bacterium]
MVCPASRFGKGAFRASLLLSLTALSVAVAAPLTAIRTRLIPTVDGRLNDPCWASVPPTTGFRVMNTERLAAAQTHAQFVFDGQALYVGIRCAEPNVESIKTRPLPRDNADVFRTDCVEVMLDPTAGRNDYFHLGVNASGTLSDRSCTQGGFVGDMSWDSTARVASFIGADFWSCELAIPFACLAISPQVGSTWRINVCREKRNPTELSSLAEQGAFNIASRFAELTGIDVDFSRYCYAVGAPKAVTRLRDGKLELTLHVPLRDLTGHPGRRLLDGWLLSPSGQVVSVGQTIDFAGKSEQTATLGPLVLEEQGDYASTVRVADPVTKEVLAFRQSRQPIQFIPIAVKLLTPWYRDCIFATQNVTQVIMDIELNLDESARTGSKLLVDIRQAGAAEPLADRTVTPVPETSRVTFPAESLPEGTLEVRARLIDADGQEIALTVKPLRKLPRKSGEIWLGQDLQWYVDGKPFFLNGGWNYAADFVDGYNAFTGERPGEAKLLDTTLMNQGKRMKSLEQKRLSPEDAELVRQHIRTKRDHAALFGYYICDEPECHSTQASALAGV